MQVEIQIDNLNDSPVRFTQFLYTAVVKEDVAPGQTILQVLAIDKDNSKHGNLTTFSYTVSDPNFSIDNEGRISALNKLDADQSDSRFFIYKFNVTVSDTIFEDTATVHLR